MGNPQHLEWLLEGVEAWNARRERTPFIPNLSRLNIHKAFAVAKKLLPNGNIPLRGLNLSDAQIDYANFRDAYLQSARLHNASCEHTSFRQANLKFADLRHAMLEEADFVGSNLRHADLRKANLRETDLRKADLTGATVTTFSIASDQAMVWTDLSKILLISQAQLDSMKGDSLTVIPNYLDRPHNWESFQLDLFNRFESENLTDTLNELTTPLVRASALDFAFSDVGIEARLSEEQAIHPPLLAGGCGTRRDALIDNARHIAKTINNQLAEQSRSDLIDYASHLETADPANPHRLNFIAVGIRADLEDDFKSGGFDNRLRRQLDNFLDQHKTFLNDCAPEAAEAIRIKAEAELTEAVSKEQVTDILDKLTSAIEATESATASVEKMLEDMRAYDDELTALKLKISAAKEKALHEAKVQAEAKELITITSRLYWRAREAIEKHSPKDVRDVSAYVTVGREGTHAALIIVDKLTPLMHWFGKLLSALPPL